MTDNVHEIASHPGFGLSTRFDSLAQYDPSQEQVFRSLANTAREIARGLKREAVEYDSSLRIVQADFQDKDISVDGCWKLTEISRGGADLLDIKSGKTIKTYSYYVGYVLTKFGEILEYEKAGDAEDDMGLIHVVDRHKGVYVRKGLLSKRCYSDKNIMTSLADRAEQAGLDKNI